MQRSRGSEGCCSDLGPWSVAITKTVCCGKMCARSIPSRWEVCAAGRCGYRFRDSWDTGFLIFFWTASQKKENAIRIQAPLKNVWVLSRPSFCGMRCSAGPSYHNAKRSVFCKVTPRHGFLDPSPQTTDGSSIDCNQRASLKHTLLFLSMFQLCILGQF